MSRLSGVHVNVCMPDQEKQACIFAPHPMEDNSQPREGGIWTSGGMSGGGGLFWMEDGSFRLEKSTLSSLRSDEQLGRIKLINKTEVLSSAVPSRTLFFSFEELPTVTRNELPFPRKEALAALFSPPAAVGFSPAPILRNSIQNHL
ncbi:hypothetical protein AMECASPLE_036435 [Ameca splendens]|uniref:Uncharacterized protein n=1 Tax=Ameca splendens TaxID=208324 RepID=A0ABV1A305_9TELE